MEKENKKGKGIGFERIRRVTGYLSGDVSRFNNAKRAEEKDRVKHSGISALEKDLEAGKSLDLEKVLYQKGKLLLLF